LRGKFFRRDAKLQIPVYLEKETLQFVEKIARKRKSDLSTVVNGLLKADIEVLRSAT
jgi:hypothetical protein